MSAVRETRRTTMNPQSNRRGSNEELVIEEIGQVGTQFDGFAHQTVGNSPLIVEPLKIQGGTGSTVAPIAIR